jgi:PAS domain S-box-containing protein
MLYRHLLREHPAATHLCDADGLITYFNDSAARLWGRAPKLNDASDRFCGSFRLYTPEGDPIPHEDCWTALALRHERAYDRHEVVIEQPGGTQIHALAHAKPLHDGSGKLVGVLNMTVDITDQNNLLATHRSSEDQFRMLNATLEERVQERTRELYEANQLLASRNQELQDFAHVASHDLQEPLRKFRTFLDLLRSELDRPTDSVLDYVARMDASAARMSDLIRALLAYSRVGSRGHRFETTDLSSILHDVVGDLDDRILESSGQVDVMVSGTIEGDPAQLRQLFQNLLSNALKFHRVGAVPLVRIRSHPVVLPSGADALRVEVSDNGIGFDEKYLDRIFVPFQRLQGRSAYEGTGMGLAICKRIVERHGGRLWARSTPGRGSTFEVIFPVSDGVEGDDG